MSRAADDGVLTNAIDRYPARTLVDVRFGSQADMSIQLVGIGRQRQRDREHAGVAFGAVLDVELMKHLEFGALPLTTWRIGSNNRPGEPEENDLS